MKEFNKKQEEPNMFANQCDPMSVSETENEQRSDDESAFPTPNLQKPQPRKPKKQPSDTMITMQQHQISRLQEELKNVSQLVDASQKRSTNTHPALDDQYQELTLYKNQYNTIYDALRSDEILVAESTYIDYIKIPQSDRSLKQNLAVYIFEKLSKVKKDQETKNKDYIKMSREQETLKNELQIKENDNALLESNQNKIKNDMNDKQQSHIKREQEMQSNIKKLHSQLDGVRDKELKYDSYILKFDQIERNNADLRATIEDKERILKRLTSETNNVDNKFNHMQTEIDVLKKDKSFLNEKNSGLIIELRSLKDEIISRDEKISDLKNSKKKLKQELNQLSEVAKHKNVDELLKNELDKLRVRTDEEVRTQKRYMQEVHQSETKILKEQLDSLKDHNDKLENKMRMKERQQDEVMSEQRLIRSKLEGELNELRSEVKVKSFELERLNLYMEDSMNNSKKVMQDNLIITEKFELLKGEYNKLEAEYNRVGSELKAELQVRKEALGNQEEMEAQLDRMLNNPSSWDKMGNVLSSFPTKSSVRIKHAMKIASKLNDSHAQNAMLKKELEENRALLVKLQGEQNVLKKVSNLSDKPYGFMVKDLEKKEVELINLRNNNEKLVLDQAKTREELNKVKESRDRMLKEFDEIKNRRKNLENIQNKIEALMKGRKIKV